ncbi:GNAT family N-acetyltransferase [Aeromonas aquatica]|uniref:GNAT family N-acetyltransferase n=1 Tax=Aeromonas aquatica TaxID=558964 RepID=UPI00286ED094|nr:GNAT family N-acetyltransferase [Aeromonas aquatica]
MELLIEGGLWQPHWQGALQAWRGQGHRWQLLQSKRAAHYPEGEAAPWAACPPDGTLSASALLAAWLDGDEAPCMGADPSQRILISASSALLILAKESGLLTLGPVGADLALNAGDDLAAVLRQLLARRLVIPELREPEGPGALVLRPLRPEDEADIARYCSDEALARYTLNIPHPYPPEAARDWLALSGRKAALGLGWTWALTLDPADEPAPLIGVISLHWNGELAWWVGLPWQNRGLATRAAALVRSFAFEAAKLPALTARHMPDNLASGRVMAKLGMHYGGRSTGTDRYPGELSHWRLDRSLALPEQVLARLAPLLADPQVAVVILHSAWARGEDGGALELALFMDNADLGSERARIAGVELVIRRHPFAWLARRDPWQESHCGGALLKDRGESGLDYLRRRLGERQ